MNFFFFLIIIIITIVIGSVSIVKSSASYEFVKNFKIQIEKNENELLVKRNDDSNSKHSMNSKFSPHFPDEMSAQFEAYGKQFTIRLTKNEGLLSKSVKIELISAGNEEKENILLDGAAYKGISLEVRDLNRTGTIKSSRLNDPFARFYATNSKTGNGLVLQGGFEWENIFFKIGTQDHPNIKNNNSFEVSLLKRSELNLDRMVLLKETMNQRNKQSFGFSFNGGTNSTIPYRCGHDDVKFNVDPRGVGNDFAKKISISHHKPVDSYSSNDFSFSISPLTKQYYMDKRAAVAPTAGCPASRKVLYMGIAADSAYVQKFNGNRQSALSNVLSDINLVSAIYEKTFNIELGILSIVLLDPMEQNNPKISWNMPCKSVSIGDRLNAFSKWRDSQNKDAGLYHLVSGCSDSETVGIAWLNQVCQVKSFKGGDSNDVVSGTSVSVLIPNQFAVIAHEIGHNFGAIHDCDAQACSDCKGGDCKCCTCGPCDCKGKYVMNPESGGLNVKEFSPCAQSDICYKMNILGKCLQDPGKYKTIKKAVCGNGVLEEGEECDCGSEEECRKSQCCTSDCKLKVNAQCSDENHACCNNCKIRSETEAFKCFSSKTKCQSDSICDGIKAVCPNSIKAIDGSVCELEGGKCASGVCTSRDLQCRAVGKRLGITKACQATPNTCQLICEDGSNNNNQRNFFSSSSCIAMSSFFMDGTPCGTTGICSEGKCSESSVNAFVEENPSLVIVAGILVGSLFMIFLLRLFLYLKSRNRNRPPHNDGNNNISIIRRL